MNKNKSWSVVGPISVLTHWPSISSTARLVDHVNQLVKKIMPVVPNIENRQVAIISQPIEEKNGSGDSAVSQEQLDWYLLICLRLIWRDYLLFRLNYKEFIF